MRFHRGLRVWACFLWLSGSAGSTGCTALRELPRGQYAALPERNHVRVVTNDGLLYEFDYAQFGADTVTGFKRRDTEDRVEEYASLAFPLGNVAQLAIRQVDWQRTGLLGGLILIGVLVGAYTATQNNNGGGNSGGGGTRPPPG